MKNNKTWCMIIFILLIIPFSAHAAEVAGLEPGSLEAAATAAADPVMSATGWASRLFGDIFMNPLSGEPDSAIGAVIVMINLALMLMGTIWVTYSIVSAGAMTAQEGQFLGRTMHSAWVPLRLTIGAASLTPFFNGFCAAQIVILMAIKLSIGAGNLALEKGIDYVADHNGVVKPAINSTKNTDLVRELFISNLCMLGLNNGMGLISSEGVPEWRVIRVKETSGTPISSAGAGADEQPVIVSFADGRGDQICGSYSVPAWQKSEFESLNSHLHDVAYELNGQSTLILTSPDQSTPLPNYDPAIINQIAEIYIQSQQKIAERLAQQEMTRDPARAEMLAQMKEKSSEAGFVTAASFTYTLASKNSALNAKISDSPTLIKSPISPKNPSIEYISNVYTYTTNIVNHSFSNRAEDAGSANGEAFMLKQVKDRVCINKAHIGECAASWLVSDSDHESALIRIAKLGDDLIWAGLGIGAATNITNAVMEAEENSALGQATKLSGADIILATAKGTLQQMLRIAESISIMLIVFGAVASTYIPLVPSIVWLYRLASMMAIWFEGVIGASVWAFSHLDTAGEGLGQRANHGYLFVFAVLLNPMLMVLGLFAGIGILEIMTNFLNAIFPSMIADISQDSMVGLLKITSFIVIYILICLGLINSTSQLINVIPDQVIAWAGGQFQNTLGRNEVDQISGKVPQALQAIANASGGVILKPNTPSNPGAPQKFNEAQLTGAFGNNRPKGNG